MLRQWILLIILVIGITACTTTEPVTDVPFSTATPRPIETVEVPNSLGSAVIPSDFTGGDPIILGDFGSFNVEIAGEFASQFDSGTLVYNYLPNTELRPARNQLYLSNSSAGASQQVTLEFSPEIAIGQYEIVAPDAYFQGVVSASYERLIFDGADTRIESFEENTTGSLTLTVVGEVLSGEFEFSTDFTERSDEGEVDVQSIVVIGHFENVPYQTNLSDPFELAVPLPTRDSLITATEVIATDLP